VPVLIASTSRAALICTEADRLLLPYLVHQDHRDPAMVAWLNSRAKG
jgi:hypothetical protein